MNFFVLGKPGEEVAQEAGNDVTELPGHIYLPDALKHLI